MAKKKLDSSVKHSRTRSGCLTCRDRHMKCDEQQPVCKNCQRSKRRCYRGIRLNFTQYSIYLPSPAAPVPLDPPAAYRLLDQSITIASLYNNGVSPYEPYMHLHSHDELRESDRQYERDINLSAPAARSPSYDQEPPKAWNMDDSLMLDPYRRASMAANTVIASLRENPVYENVNLKDFLTDEQLDLTQSSHPLRAMAAETNTGELLAADLNASELVSLIHGQKFYWLLDLVNGLNAWKLIITRYCLDSLLKTHPGSSDNDFLVRCLLGCSTSDDSQIDGLLEEQASRWALLRYEPLGPETLNRYETILISVALMLLRSLLRIQHSLPVESVAQTLPRQTAIFYSIVTKYHALPQAQAHRLRTVVLVTTVQSVTMLKYFLNKLVEFGDSPGKDSVAKESDLTAGELMFLKSFYKDLDYSSSTYHMDIDPFVESKLDARKLRELIWYLIRTEHLARNPDEDLEDLVFGEIFSNEYDLFSTPGLSGVPEYASDQAVVEAIPKMVLPSEQGLAIYLVKEYINKCINANTPELVQRANTNLTRIFNCIECLTMEASLKLKWTQNFRWMLH